MTVGSAPAVAPRLSVVVPFYDVEDYLGPCLESLARQTFANFEVVLVDDGSRDGSARLAKAFCERDTRFRLVTQENQGLGPARNTGVRHADGEFLAFVDSDDLVVRNAFELMIRSLDETGSSFVAGDARRFNNSSGVRESWLHRVPFAQDRPAISVFEFPELALDRMVWNKVYRRSFWDKHGYEFPPIRYEDYPVTLRAHLEAAAVDCLAAPVYYWRERESGESITQRRFEYANLHDRVVSAGLVLDLVDDLAPRLRDRVHRHFVQIDYAALVEAFASVPDQEQERLLGLCQRFAERLDRRALAEASPYDRLQHRAVAAADLDLLRRLARYRLDGGLREGPRARRRPTMPWRFEHRYPGLHDRPRTAPRELYELSAESMFLRTRVTAIAWDETALIIRGIAEIRHLRTSHRSDLSLSLVYGSQVTALPVRRFRAVDSHGDRVPAGFQVRVPRAVLAAFPTDGKTAHLAVEFRQGRARRSGMLSNLRAGNPQWAHGAWVTDEVWIQPRRGGDGRLLLQQIVRPTHLTSAEAGEDGFVLAGRLPGAVARASLQIMPSATAALPDVETHFEGTWTRFTARVPFAAIVDAADIADPFTDRATRALRLGDGTSFSPLLATGLQRAVSAVFEGRLLTLTRSPGNYVSIQDGPVLLTADTADVHGGARGSRLAVSGLRWEAGDGGSFVWRRFLDDSDDYVDVPCLVEGDDRRWSASVDVEDLIPGARASRFVDPLACLVDWALFVVPAAASPYAVPTEAYLLGRLPIERTIRGRGVTLQPRAGTLHLEVR